MRRVLTVLLGASALALAGCDDLAGLEARPSPLARIHVQLTGDLETLRPPGAPPPDLRAAVQWLLPGLADPFCVPPAQNPQHAEVMAAGCRDPLAVASEFLRIDDTVPVADDGSATIELFELPSVVFGDSYGQIGFASLVVIGRQDTPRGQVDVFRAASFTSMTQPDTRLAFRHGRFDDALAFYPRRGCGAPPQGFSLVSAGGFTLDQAIAAQRRGELPVQDPAGCREDPVSRTVELAVRSPDELAELACAASAAAFYTAPADRLEPGQLAACVQLRDREGELTDRVEAVVSGPPAGSCKSIVHHVLRGCFVDPLCATPDWDVPAPAWWPCAGEAVP